MTDVSDEISRKIQNTHFMSNNLIFENRAVYEIMWKNIVESGRPDDITAHAHCTLDT
jgi:hypothetical protein